MTSARTVVWVVVCASLALRCGGDDSLGVGNVAPEGSVGGLVLDAATRKPLAKVSVRVIAGGAILPAEAAQSDDSGRFAIQKVPAGDVIVQLTPPKGYAPVQINATLEGSAGDFPLGNATLSLGPIGVVPLATSKADGFAVRLVTPGGVPAASVDASLRTSFSWISYEDGVPTAKGAIVVEGVSDNSGVIRFSGIPHYGKLAGLMGKGAVSDELRLVIAPFDTNDDGSYEFLGKQVTFNATQLSGSSMPTVVLDSGLSQLKILAASVGKLYGKKLPRVLKGTSGPLRAVFNMPLDSSTSALLYDEEGKKLSSSAVSVKVDGNLLVLSLSGLQAAREYNLLLNAAALVGGQRIVATFGTPFFTPATSTAVVKVASVKKVGSAHHLRFSEPLGTGSSSTNSQRIVYVDYDLNGSSTTGDAAGELGASSTAITLSHLEVDPPGPAGRSGFASGWSVTLPKVGANALPSGTTVWLKLGAATPPITRASGEAVEALSFKVP